MLALTCSIMIAAACYLILDKHRIRQLFGILLLSTTLNIILLMSGHMLSQKPAFVSEVDQLTSNSVVQALILTAIVIGFGLFAFLCVLLKSMSDQNQMSTSHHD